MAHLIVDVVTSSGTGSISKIGGGANSGAGNIFAVPPLFRGAPMTGHYRKMQGTVTRTELGQKWPTVRGQSDL